MPHQALTPAEALVASLDGQGTIAPGSRGDVVLLDADPLAVPADSREACDVLREMPVAATIVAGRLTHAG
ncbi:amidohydrolase family protein [Mobilicoccus caccae]|nr:amidohydrolase family protein [Mobilicoccus caccae]